MGWVVFILGFLIVIPVGWFLFTRARADRFLTAVGLVLIPPTIWAAAIGLQIGPCDTPECVTNKQQDLLMFAVAGLVVLALALAAVATLRTLPAAGLMILAPVLDMVSTWKIDRVTTIMFFILAAVVVAYVVFGLLPRRRFEASPSV
jgi:hypothetical protein